MNITAMTDHEVGWGYKITTQIVPTDAGLPKHGHVITAFTKKLAFDKLVEHLIWLAFEYQEIACSP